MHARIFLKAYGVSKGNGSYRPADRETLWSLAITETYKIFVSVNLNVSSIYMNTYRTHEHRRMSTNGYHLVLHFLDGRWLNEESIVNFEYRLMMPGTYATLLTPPSSERDASKHGEQSESDDDDCGGNCSTDDASSGIAQRGMVLVRCL